LVSDISGEPYTEGVREQGAEENVWTKGDEVIGGSKKLHKEELLNLYSSPSIIRIIKSLRMRWAGHVAHVEEKRNAYSILVGRPVGRTRCRLGDNIKMDLREMGWGDVDWIDLAQDRDQWNAFVKAVMNLRVP
jgi:hypothetical protein